MDKKPNERAASLQANRILYLVIIGVLCLAAIIVGITAALRRPAGTNLPSLAPSNESTEQPSENGTQAPAPESSATPPALESPVSGNVNKKHDLSVRTVYRYVDTLSMSVPVYVKRGRSGGIYIADSYKLPMGFMTQAEYDAIIDALEIAYSQTPEERFLIAKEKISSQKKLEKQEDTPHKD
jgi:hypothetical protein